MKICHYIAKRNDGAIILIILYLFFFSDFGSAKQKLQKMESLKQLFACGICKKSFNLAKALSEHVELHRSRKEPKNSQKMPQNENKVTINTNGKTEKKTNQQKNCPMDNSVSIQHTLNNIDPDKIDCKEESKDEPFSCNICAKKFTRHTFMINHRYSIYIRTLSFKLLHALLL